MASLVRVSTLGRKVGPKKTWSVRLLPTPGRSATTGMPREVRRDAGPTPDTMRSWGDWKAPAESMTSLRAVRVAPGLDMPVARLEGEKRIFLGEGGLEDYQVGAGRCRVEEGGLR